MSIAERWSMATDSEKQDILCRGIQNQVCLDEYLLGDDIKSIEAIADSKGLPYKKIWVTRVDVAGMREQVAGITAVSNTAVFLRPRHN